MKLRIVGCRAQCGQLMEQFDRRVEIDTNLKVVNIENVVKTIEHAVDRNCAFRSIHIRYKIFTIIIVLGIQQGFKTIKDDQLGA
jgi:hypothetical protein